MKSNEYNKFYSNPSIEKLQELIDSKKLENSDIYDFLSGYSDYLRQQVKLDSL